MKKVLFYPCLWGVLLTFLLFACRTEDNLSQQNNESKQRFAIFIPQSPDEKVDYANGFAYLYQNYYNVNNVDKNQQKAVINSFGVVDFRIHSQLLMYKDGSKAMIFPIRSKGITTGLVMGILENEETNLRYVRLEESYEGYSEIIQNFSKNDKKFRISDLAVASMKKNDDVREHPDEPKREDDDGPVNPPEKTIPEVIIIVPAPLPTVPTIPIIPNVPVIPPGGGGCGAYGGCNPPPPGGGGTPHAQQDACSKASTVGKTNDTKKLMSNLKKLTTSTIIEHGYLLTDAGGGKTNDVPVQGSPGAASIQINVSSPIDGYIHSHYQGLLSIFSVSDIFAIAQLYKNNMIKNLDTFTIGVVTASGTQYLMVIDNTSKFTNFASNLFSGNNIDPIAINAYETIYAGFGISTNNTPDANEKAFLSYLALNDTGLSILKGSSDMQTWSKLSKDSNGNVVPNKCP
ncbi:hypothetical protein [Elizabethkingia anophelis]|uniref:hypothetical protein n=1 Tax=Elizabethkingia anophelis TaxID=1117645 RepID=UPI003891A3B3